MTHPRLPPAVLPNWRPRTELSRPSAERVSRAENRKQTLTYAGPNAVIPLIYGEQVAAGPVIAGPVVSGSTLIWAVALCWAGSNGVERIEDVRLGDAVTVLPAISVANTGATGSVSGVSVRVYDGRQTAVNAELASAIAGFTDTFAGIAYARVSVSVSAFTSFPELTFRVKGRKCHDPRTGATAWTENPVLHMWDFVTNADFGMGVNMIGVAAAADIADTLYSGLPRARTGLTIQDPMTEEDALALFAQYAEVLWSYDGQDVSVIPDAPVDTIYSIDLGTIRENSIVLSTVGLEQIPTQVRILFADRNEPTWAPRPAIAEVPEHTLHGLPTSPSSVPLPGVYNRIEAERRAYQRLMRLQAPGRVEWQMFGPGMPYQAGDVVRLPDVRGMQSIEVRLTAQPEMVGPLLYQMAGEIYRASSYPSGSAGIAVPTGAILIFLSAGPAPDGWSLLNTNNRLIREGAPGNAGSLTSVSYSFQTTSDGAHTGTRDTSKPSHLIWDSSQPGVSTYGPRVYVNNPQGSGHVGGHQHSYVVNSDVKNVVRQRSFRFVKRTGAPALLAPGLTFLGAENLATAQAMEVSSSNDLGGYLTGWDGTSPKGGSVFGTKSVTLTGMDHSHTAISGFGRIPTTPVKTMYVARAAGAHSHTVSVSVTGQLRSIALALFESMGDAALPEGAIVGWDGGAVPPGWALCNGQNGTIDLRDRFIYLTRSEQAGVEFHGTSTYSITSTNASHAPGHQHGYEQIQREYDEVTLPNWAPFHTSVDGAHSHSVNPSTPGVVDASLDNIVRYQLRFIQYIGE